MDIKIKFISAKELMTTTTTGTETVLSPEGLEQMLFNIAKCGTGSYEKPICISCGKYRCTVTCKVW